MKIIGIRDFRGFWYLVCKKCGEKIHKDFLTDDSVCSCGYVWQKLDRKEIEKAKVAYITE